MFGQKKDNKDVEPKDTADGPARKVARINDADSDLDLSDCKAK